MKEKKKLTLREMNNYNDIVTRKQRMSKFKEPNFLQALIIFALIIVTLDIVEDWILYLIALN